MRIAAVQHDIVWEDRDATLAHLGPQVARAAATGARLVALTEMFATGFSMRTHLTAEPIDGPSVSWLRERAAEHDVWLAASVPISPPGAPGPGGSGPGGSATVAGDGSEPSGEAEAADDPTSLPTNTLILAAPDGSYHRYDKIHPFSYAGEHERFRPGTQNVVVEVEDVRLGLSICYDLRFADLYWDRAADVDAELIVANWPAARRHHWRSLVDARAIENQCYVVAANRVGTGGNKLDYAGDSRVVDPMGEVLAAGAGGETILTAELDPKAVAEARERFPFQADRRFRAH